MVKVVIEQYGEWREACGKQGGGKKGEMVSGEEWLKFAGM
jgi:hypothetical protein